MLKYVAILRHINLKWVIFYAWVSLSLMVSNYIQGWVEKLIAGVVDFFGQWNTSTATLKEEMHGQQEILLKINHIWLHTMRVSWSAYELLANTHFVLITPVSIRAEICVFPKVFDVLNKSELQNSMKLLVFLVNLSSCQKFLSGGTTKIK